MSAQDQGASAEADQAGRAAPRAADASRPSGDDPSRERLLELAEQCEMASGPDRELDIQIKAAVHGGVALLSPFNGEWCVYRAGTEDPRSGKTLERPRTVPHECWISDRYTASLDAAITLVPEGFGKMVGDYFMEGDGRGPVTAECYDIDYIRATDGDSKLHVQVWAQTHALALCAAALRARAGEP